MEHVKNLLSLLKNSKLKFLVLIVSAVVFLFTLFPFDDLGDLVSSQVAQLSGNSLYVQFDKLKMSIIPQPGVQLKDVFVESRQMPPLSASELTITPSTMGLIQKKPYGHISAKGFLKGDVDLRVSKGARSDNGVERQQIEISAQKLNLTDLRELANLPVMLKGKLDLKTTALADLTLQEQPEVDIAVQISQFELPPANVNTAMGPLTLPDLKLTAVELKGRLAAGRFIIESGTIGRTGDELQGTIKGNLGLNVQNQGGTPVPQMGAYNIEVDLRAKRSFQDRAALFLSFIDSYKTPTSDGAQYKFKVFSNSPQLPPTMSAVR